MTGFETRHSAHIKTTEPAVAAAADATVAAAGTAAVLHQPGGRTEERLLRHLLGGEFDVDARGVNLPNTTVTVRIQFLLLRIQGLVSAQTVGLCRVTLHRERKCADTIGTVPVPRAGYFQC